MTIKIGLVGTGAIALQNHVAGVALCKEAQIVALCDSDQATVERAGQQTGLDSKALFTDYTAMLAQADLDAVIIATPNAFHVPIALAAIRAGKHVLCEKPLGLNATEVRSMYTLAEEMKVRHMTAFTYRFVPAMRYMEHLVHSGAIGTPYHFRAQRFLDWGDRYLGWRQSAQLAGSGDLGDMLSHRIDYGLHLVGPIKRLVARTRRFVEVRQDAAGNRHPSTVDDWSAILADFAGGATGVWESTELATGRGEDKNCPDVCEINGNEGTLAYRLQHPHELEIGKVGDKGFKSVPVPEEFLKIPGSPRDPHRGDPLLQFRYDQDFEFIQAILEDRPCQPSFKEGLAVQEIMDAALNSDKQQSWVELAN